MADGRRAKGPEYQVADMGYETPCWLWLRSPRNGGYGVVRINGVLQQAHRAIYEREVGPIPAGRILDHKCEQRRCVNPAHMEPITQAENVRRGKVAKLSHDLVREIRSSSESARSIGRRLGISHNAVAAARRGETWSVTE